MCIRDRRSTLEDAAQAGPETREAMIQAAIAETDEILGIFAALMRISQIEGGQGREAFRDFDLVEVAERVAEAYAPSAEAGGRRLVTDLPSTAMVRGDPVMLSQALANLIENGLTHTPTGSTLRVAVTLSASRVGLSVADDGAGVAEADLGKLGERFFRADRSRHAPGAGLGLAMVVAVADIHRAAYQICNLEPGLVVELGFPSAAAS